MLRTIPDGVKRKNVTASGVKSMTTHRKPEGIKRRASRVFLVTACTRGKHNGVRPRSRQFEKLFGGEMTASDICS